MSRNVRWIVVPATTSVFTMSGHFRRNYRMLVIPLLLAGCATHVQLSPPELTVVWGDSYVVTCTDGVDPDTQECVGGSVDEVRGGFISDTFGKWLGKLVNGVVSMFPGGGSADETTVKVECAKP
jgi:hypothetical protein